MLALAKRLSSEPPDPVLLFILNLFGAAGLGYWILGQREKAVIGFVLFAALAYPTCFSASLLVSGVAAVDAYLQARQIEAGRAAGKWTFFNR